MVAEKNRRKTHINRAWYVWCTQHTRCYHTNISRRNRNAIQSIKCWAGSNALSIYGNGLKPLVLGAVCAAARLWFPCVCSHGTGEFQPSRTKWKMKFRDCHRNWIQERDVYLCTTGTTIQLMRRKIFGFNCYSTKLWLIDYRWMNFIWLIIINGVFYPIWSRANGFPLVLKMCKPSSDPYHASICMACEETRGCWWLQQKLFAVIMKTPTDWFHWFTHAMYRMCVR